MQDGNVAISKSPALAALLRQCTETYSDGRFFLHSSSISLPSYALCESGAFLRSNGAGEVAGETKEVKEVTYSADLPACFHAFLKQLGSL